MSLFCVYEQMNGKKDFREIQEYEQICDFKRLYDGNSLELNFSCVLVSYDSPNVIFMFYFVCRDTA